MDVFEKLEISNKTNSDIDFDALIKKTFVDLKIKIDRPETLISIGEHEYKNKLYPTSVMTSGEFSCIVAPSKTKKSFLKFVIQSSVFYLLILINDIDKDFLVYKLSLVNYRTNYPITLRTSSSESLSK